MTVKVQADDFDLAAELAEMRGNNHNIGAVASFVGLVRDMADLGDGNRDQVSAMTLEHYPGMTEKMLTRIEAEAHARWPLEASLILHRHGRLEAGAQIVLVACASPHRTAALEACHFLIDWLKTEAPFWKLEQTPDGGGHWVAARDSDTAATDKWR